MIDDCPNTTDFKAFIDRVENGLAVVVAEDGFQFDVPLDRLPPEAKAGDHLVVSFRIDAETTSSTLERITELQRELTQSGQPENFEL